MLRLARASVSWPGLVADIRSLVDRCSQCQAYARANSRETLQPIPPAPYPWHSVALDIFYLEGDLYLVAVDYFSKDFMLQRMRNITARAVIKVLSQWWVQHGLPREIVSDNGKPFSSSAFKQKTREWDSTHRTTSTYHAAANDQVERTVQTIKRVLKRTRDSGGDVDMALLALRTTPAADGIAPAELSNGRQIRSAVPMAGSLLERPRRVLWDKRRSFLQMSGRIVKQDVHQRANDLPPLA